MVWALWNLRVRGQPAIRPSIDRSPVGALLYFACGGQRGLNTCVWFQSAMTAPKRSAAASMVRMMRPSMVLTGPCLFLWRLRRMRNGDVVILLLQIPQPEPCQVRYIYLPCRHRDLQTLPPLAALQHAIAARQLPRRPKDRRQHRTSWCCIWVRVRQPLWLRIDVGQWDHSLSVTLKDSRDCCVFAACLASLVPSTLELA